MSGRTSIRGRTRSSFWQLRHLREKTAILQSGSPVLNEEKQLKIVYPTGLSNISHNYTNNTEMLHFISEGFLKQGPLSERLKRQKTAGKLTGPVYGIYIHDSFGESLKKTRETETEKKIVLYCTVLYCTLAALPIAFLHSQTITSKHWSFSHEHCYLPQFRRQGFVELEILHCYCYCYCHYCWYLSQREKV